MGWSGGIYTRERDFTDDDANGIKMLSANFDEEHDAIETGFNNCLTKDGSNSPSANLPMASKRHTGVADAESRTDYATLGQVQDGFSKAAATGGVADVYTLTLTPTLTSYTDGLIVVFKAHATNTGATTLNVDSLGAKTIKMNLSDLSAGDITLSRTYIAVYYSGDFHLFSQQEAAATPQYKIVKEYFTSNDTWTCPTGVTKVLVQLWGGGGGGGTSYAGQGGCYAEKQVTVIPDDDYGIVIGDGGAAGSGPVPNINGTSGGESTFNTDTVVAKGGAANGAAQGASSTGDLTIDGGSGLQYTKDMDSEIEGYFGGWSAFSAAADNMFRNGVVPGGGGSIQRLTTQAYYSGGDGFCTLTYVELIP